ncbi:regulator of chromosome condensation 1/beta-lactamase-inhibitor protein II [Trichophaea hybrida]|nr:regulator of chromosome condensation 1/beta-lactamase-inhibitor protein II [Trichophaea hybrida]
MLFAFGSNGSSQLSLGNDEDTHIPTQCLVPENFPTESPKQIVAGGNHTLILFSCGSLFATGSNQYGQCGIPTSAGISFSSFQKVSNPPREDGEGAGWALASAGWDFTILVSTNGSVYSCGFGSKGELGLGAETLSAPSIHRLNPFSESRIVSMASGMAHTLATLESGEVYGWGAARKGQLGSPAEKTLSTPRKITLPFPAAAAACGREFSFVISEDGSRHAILGGNERFPIRSGAPDQGELRGWKRIGAAWGSVVMLLADGSIRAWGRNDRGQLPPARLRGVKDLAVGSEHGVAVVDGRFVAWGWGEHGNCGKEGGSDVVGEVFEVKVEGDGEVKGVGAGCATSWIWRE